MTAYRGNLKYANVNGTYYNVKFKKINYYANVNFRCAAIDIKFVSVLFNIIIYKIFPVKEIA